ncbi:reverse transcriptase domain-containing protein [Idiomarina sp.]|uniref:reverse transcriptase domain-containing protein n=1 Tax=Idiomarina sp. TaxID=1874361 RepID=UPI003A950435
MDLYYASNPSLLAIADYEDDLENNLKRLQKKINGKSVAWIKEESFLGSWSLIPKSYSVQQRKVGDVDCKCVAKDETGIVFASTARSQNKYGQCEGDSAEHTATFRLMAECTMDLHVLAALWIMEVGAEFDSKLSDSVRGSRLRRQEKGEKQFNELSLGSFKPYLKPFKDWRDDGIQAMQKGLKADKKLVALTADVTSYYHRLQPDFMLNEEFHKLIGIQLSADQNTLNKLFIGAVKAWAKLTPLGRGLPVGLPASAIIANLALFELDQIIEKKLRPLYYGRYVDDIMLVLENTTEICSQQDLWKLIANVSGNTLMQDEKSVRFQAEYLEDSEIAFENEKNKAFVLDGLEGQTMINAIAEQINHRASEWRSLPKLPMDTIEVATDLMKATNSNGEHADSLRKTDALSLNRASFAIKLRDFEAYERDLPPKAWEEIRHAFYEAVITHVFVPEKYFQLAAYVPRIVRLAAVCEDFKYLGKMMRSLLELIDSVSDLDKIKIAGIEKDSGVDDKDQRINRWKNKLLNEVLEHIIAAFPFQLSANAKKVWYEETEFDWFKVAEHLWFYVGYKEHFITSIPEIQKQTRRLFRYDLAHNPLRFIGLPRELIQARHVPVKRKLKEPADLSFTQSDHERFEPVKGLANWMKMKVVPSGLVFSTRPYSLNELSLICPNPFDSKQTEELKRVMRALRGFDLGEKMPTFKTEKGNQVLSVPDGEIKSKQTIAVSSWQTENESFIAAVTKNVDPDALGRYQRLNRMLNHLLDQPDGAGYLVLPELALPAKWFIRVADKLKGKGISLITGIEYLHDPKKRVRNQVWASLTHDGLGFPSQIIYRQDKQSPALHEEREIYRLSGVTMQPKQTWKAPPIIEHRNFRFALMICSELTNIHYRAALRGKIDALFVPEWNTDTETFNSLVEATALDVHTYVIQVNDRKYGDSRVRSPAKERYQRDVLRVKGGIHDYCVTGEIDIQALREFQSSHRSPSKPFKPVPDGFNTDMAHDRKALPKGDA